jgi:hypothetical protein
VLLIIGVRQVLTSGEFGEEDAMMTLDSALDDVLRTSTPCASFDFHFSRDEVACNGTPRAD